LKRFGKLAQIRLIWSNINVLEETIIVHTVLESEL
jgi:hypothetical protein